MLAAQRWGRSTSFLPTLPPALHVAFLLDVSESSRNEDESSGTSRLQAQCDAIRLLAADADPTKVLVLPSDSSVSSSSNRPRRSRPSDMILVNSSTWAEQLAGLTLLAESSSLIGGAAPTGAVMRRAELAMRSGRAQRGGSVKEAPPQMVVVVFLCSQVSLDTVGEMSDSAALLRSAGLKLHIVQLGETLSEECRHQLSCMVQCDPSSGACLAPYLACDGCGSSIFCGPSALAPTSFNSQQNIDESTVLLVCETLHRSLESCDGTGRCTGTHSDGTGRCAETLSDGTGVTTLPDAVIINIVDIKGDRPIELGTSSSEPFEETSTVSTSRDGDFPNEIASGKSDGIISKASSSSAAETLQVEWKETVLEALAECDDSPISKTNSFSSFSNPKDGLSETDDSLREIESRVARQLVDESMLRPNTGDLRTAWNMCYSETGPEFPLFGLPEETDLVRKELSALDDEEDCYEEAHTLLGPESLVNIPEAQRVVLQGPDADQLLADLVREASIMSLGIEDGMRSSRGPLARQESPSHQEPLMRTALREALAEKVMSEAASLNSEQMACRPNPLLAGIHQGTSSLSEFLTHSSKIVLQVKPTADSSPPQSASHDKAPRQESSYIVIDPDAVSKTVRILSQPILSISVGKLLVLYGQTACQHRQGFPSSGRIDTSGSVTLCPDDKTNGVDGRLNLRICVDGTLKLKWECPNALYHPREELLALIPGGGGQGRGPARSSGHHRDVFFLDEDRSGRSFCIKAGKGAGCRRRYFWLQEGDLAAGKAKVEQLKTYLKEVPTISSLTGLSERVLGDMYAVAPALLSFISPVHPILTLLRTHLLPSLPAALQSAHYRSTPHYGRAKPGTQTKSTFETVPIVISTLDSGSSRPSSKYLRVQGAQSKIVRTRTLAHLSLNPNISAGGSQCLNHKAGRSDTRTAKGFFKADIEKGELHAAPKCVKRQELERCGKSSDVPKVLLCSGTGLEDAAVENRREFLKRCLGSSKKGEEAFHLKNEKRSDTSKESTFVSAPGEATSRMEYSLDGIGDLGKHGNNYFGEKCADVDIEKDWSIEGLSLPNPSGQHALDYLNSSKKYPLPNSKDSSQTRIPKPVDNEASEVIEDLIRPESPEKLQEPENCSIEENFKTRKVDCSNIFQLFQNIGQK